MKFIGLLIAMALVLSVGVMFAIGLFLPVLLVIGIPIMMLVAVRNQFR